MVDAILVDLELLTKILSWKKIERRKLEYTAEFYRSLHVTFTSVRNRSGIIAQHGVSNAKPSMVDLILWLPETNFQ